MSARTPAFDKNGLPVCSEIDCARYDGKRCRETGYRPDRFCEPELLALRSQLAAIAPFRAACVRLAEAQEAFDRAEDNAEVCRHTVTVPCWHDDAYESAKSERTEAIREVLRLGREGSEE